MSSLMLIIPDGWTSMDYEFVTNNVLDQNTIESLMLQGLSYEVDAAFSTHGLLPENKSVQEVKFVDGTYMLVRFE